MAIIKVTDHYLRKRNVKDIKHFKPVVRHKLNQCLRNVKLQVDATPYIATITKTTIGKLSSAQYKTQPVSEFKRRAEIALVLPQIVPLLQNITHQTNKKPLTRQGLSEVIKGDITVKYKNTKYKPTIVIKIFSNGDVLLYDITNVGRKIER